MTGCEPEPPDEPTAIAPVAAPEWSRHDNGRWIVGGHGRQPQVAAAPAAGRAGTRPDTIVDGGYLNGLTYRATSQRGFSHQEQGGPRQDAYLLRPTPDRRWLVGCVADGVSEGKLSHEAADLICQESTRRLAQGLGELGVDHDPEAWGRVVDAWPEVVEGLPWQEAVDGASAAVVQAAKLATRTRLRRDGDDEELKRLDEQEWRYADARKVMSSTAVLFAVSAVAVDDGSHPAALAVAAGDSSALLLSNGVWQPLTALKNDGAPIVVSAVEPLPRQVRVAPVAHRLRPGEALAVITDGLGDPLGSGGGLVGRFLATMWQSPPDLLAFAQQVGFYRQSFVDDRTAVVVWVDAPPAVEGP